MKTISIVGSTGSIGVNALRVVEAHPKKLKVVALAARKNIELLDEQARKFRPEVVCVYESEGARALERRLKKFRIRVVAGDDGLIEVSTLAGARQIIFAMAGAAGLTPMLAAISAGKSLAIANKEPLVMAGNLILSEAKRRNVPVIPIDSEHSGLWQCLEGRSRDAVKKLILTSSGGPFFGRRVDFRSVPPKQALRHPRWKMGPKITIDSATLMNKGLEVIEAMNLFGFSLDQLEVLVHPEAVVHAIVEFIDGGQLAQLGIADMRAPIQYALSYPSRFRNTLPELDLTKVGTFHFYKPDVKRFPCLQLGYEAARIGGEMPAVLNAANETAVAKFLNGAVPFSDIPTIIERVMRRFEVKQKPTIADILSADTWAREEAVRNA